MQRARSKRCEDRCAYRTRRLQSRECYLPELVQRDTERKRAGPEDLQRPNAPGNPGRCHPRGPQPAGSVALSKPLFQKGPFNSAPLNARSSYDLEAICRPVIVPAANGGKMSVAGLCRQSLGMLNRNDRVIHGPEDLNWSGVMPQCFHVIPRVAKHESDREKKESSGGYTRQGIEGNNQHNFVRCHFLPSKRAGRSAANRLSQDTNCIIRVPRAQELICL